MQLTVTVAGNTAHPLIEGGSITWDLTENQASARLSWAADSSFSIDHQDTVLIKEGATTRFTGRVMNFQKVKDGRRPGKFTITADVRDYVSLMDKRITKSYLATSDQDIIIDIISTAGLSGSITATTATIDIINSSLTVAFDSTVREALDEIASLASDAVWRLSADATLHYNAEVNADAAPFHIVDYPATNAWTRSEELNDSVWTKTDSSITANATTAPNGATTADKLVENTSSNPHLVGRNYPSHSDNTIQTASVFLKAAERSVIRLNALNKANSAYLADINLATGAVILTSGTGTTTVSPEIGAGWYRVTISQNSGSGATTPRLNIVLHNGTSPSYAGDGTSGAYVWGVQFEVDRQSAGDYVYTSSATRSGKAALGIALESRFDEPVNTVTVLGGEDVFGKTIKQIRTNSQSVTDWGTHTRTIENQALTTATLAQKFGDAFLALHAQPEVTGSGSIRDDGLEVNQLIRVTSSDYSLISKEFLISRVSAQQETATKTLWSFALGMNASREKRLLRRLGSASSARVLPMHIRGANLTGNQSYMIVQDTHALSDLFQDASGGLTISAWIRSDAAVSGYGGIMTATSSSEAANDGYTLYVRHTGSARKLRFSAGGSSGNLRFDYSSDYPESDRLWHHILVSWNGIFGASRQVAMYFDGVDGATQVNNGSGTFVQVTTSDLTLGDFASIKMAQVCAWNIQLKDGDIQRLAARPDPTIPASLFPSNRIVYWRMDDYADGVTIPKAVNTMQDTWNGFHAQTAVTTSGDFGAGFDGQWIPT